MKKTINIPGAPTPIGPYSQALLAGNTLYISGQIPINPADGLMTEGDIAAHTHRVMANIDALLQAAGMNFSNVVKTSIFLADMNDFTEVNRVYSTYFSGTYPARETIQAGRLPRDARVEISAVAQKEES
jgi:2-iminobutanoate/2-iminopropanoate deaminase